MPGPQARRPAPVTPVAQSPGSACSAGEWETPVGLRTKSMPAGTRAASTPASWPAPVGSTGAADSGGGQGGHHPVAQRGVEVHGGRDRLLGVVQVHAMGHGGGAGLRQHVVHDRVQPGLVRRPGVQPGGHRRTDRVDRARVHGQLADRGQGPVPGGRTARGQDRGGGRQHRVAAVAEPGGPGVVGAPGERQPPPAVRPDPLRHPDRGVQVRERAALLDVQFHVRADAREQRRGPGRARQGRARRRSSPRRTWCRRRRSAPGPWPARSRRPAAGCRGRPRRTWPPPPRRTPPPPAAAPGPSPARAAGRSRRTRSPRRAGRRRRRRPAPNPGGSR